LIVRPNDMMLIVVFLNECCGAFGQDIGVKLVASDSVEIKQIRI